MKPRLHMKRRLYPTLPPSPLDDWCFRGLLALAASGAASGSLWLISVAETPWDLGLVLPAVLLGLPFLTRLPGVVSFQADHHRSFTKGSYLLLAILLWSFMGDAFPGLWLVYLLYACHGYALRYARPDNLATVALLLPLVEMLLAHHVLWGDDLSSRVFVSAWMLATVLIAGGVATWIHARWTRRRLHLRDRTDLNPAEDGHGLWSRARLMMVLGLLLVPIGILLQQVALQLSSEPEVLSVGLGQDGGHGGMGGGDGETEASEEEPEAKPKLPRQHVFPSAVSWQGEITESTVDVVLFHVKTDRDLGRETPYFSPTRPLYLVATTLDTLGTTGLSRSFMSESIYHADSGLGADDWIVVEPGFAERSVVQYKIRTRPLRGDASANLDRYVHLLHDRRLVALRYPSARIAADGTALGEYASPDAFEYQWLSRPRPPFTSTLPFAQAQSRHRGLPSDEAFRPWIEQARALCADLDDPERKIERILDHFHHEYRYDRKPSKAQGVEAFTDFFSTRRGYCTYFAAAAMLYLRANEIPCRVATGFMVTEYSETHEAYVGRLPGHAWVEVAQDDGSWRTLEPTPAASRREALAMLRADQGSPEMDVPVEPAEVPEAMPDQENVEEPREEESYAFAFFGLMGLLGLLGSVMGLVVMVLFVGQFFSGVLERREEKRKQAALGVDATHALAYWTRLLDLLAALGFRHRRSQTAAEYAATVQHWGGETYRPMERVTELVYRARFGGHGWSMQEEDFLEDFEDLLERKLRENPE